MNNDLKRQGWRSRGYMPHRDHSGLVQSITFRLSDSLPRHVREKIEKELLEQDIAPSKVERARNRLREKYLDSGMGSCALGHPRMAQVMKESLLKFHGKRYDLIAWCIMPNHVHVMISQKAPLAKIIQSWKSYPARWGMENGLRYGFTIPDVVDESGRRRFWMWEYWDRYIRDEKHYYRVRGYIHQNPVKAGLCEDCKEWRWSSAWEQGK